MHIDAIDLNLLRLFDAVGQAGSVSRAAERLGLTQPAASQGLTRLRLLLKDPLFVRAPGGVRPTAKAERLAPAVRSALMLLEQALGETAGFDPAQSSRSFRIHMSDIGEGRFLPELMTALHERAPGVRLETLPLPRHQIGAALDDGRIDMAFGFLPMLKDTLRLELLRDRYIVLLRAGHPFMRQRRSARELLADLKTLDFVSVRTHADSVRILELLRLERRVRLTAEHFMALPSIVRATDLAVIMPRNIARSFADSGSYAIVEPAFPLRDFTVSLHWSRRSDTEPGNRWMRGLIADLRWG